MSTPGSRHSRQRLPAWRLSLMAIVFALLWRSATLCLQQYQNGESEESHEQFLKALQNAVSTFVNRMKSNHMRGRSITNDSAVLSLFQSINSMHPQLLELLNQLDERRRRFPPACPRARAPSKGHANDPPGPWDPWALCPYSIEPLDSSLSAHGRWSCWWGLLCPFQSPAPGQAALPKESRGHIP